MMTDTDDGVTLTVRLIRSFEHRNVKHIVMKSVDLTRLTGDFMQFVNTGTLFNYTSSVVILIYRYT